MYEQVYYYLKYREYAFIDLQQETLEKRLEKLTEVKNICLIRKNF